MRIYTRTGDAGDTGLIGGERVRKDSPRVDAYGTVDELNAHLGLARALIRHADLDVVLGRVQRELFGLGADLATPSHGGNTPPHITSGLVTALEVDIDRLDAALAPLTHFILPGGSPGGAALHVARCVCRRAERRVASLAAEEAVNPEALRYLNRLSDLLFVLARTANARDGIPEEAWTATGP